MSTDDSFNLDAAVVRAGQGELAMSVETLAATLEQALPQMVSVERRKAGGFSGSLSQFPLDKVGDNDAAAVE